MRTAGVTLLVVGLVMLIAGIVFTRPRAQSRAQRVVVTGRIIRQVGFTRPGRWEVAYPLPDGTWATAVATAPVSPGGIATLRWSVDAPVSVHVNVDDVHDVRLTPEGAVGPRTVVRVVLGIIGGSFTAIGVALLIASASV